MKTLQVQNSVKIPENKQQKQYAYFRATPVMICPMF
jgi:hypothetical protein